MWPALSEAGEDKIVITLKEKSDEQLQQGLLELSRSDQDYWSFRKNSKREHSHGLFQYPAMMVPQAARALLDQACTVHPEIERVNDPYMGSGTVLTESMLRGLSFSGTDISPLAVLLCRVKAGPFLVDELTEKIALITSRIDGDSLSSVEVDFTRRDKWFLLDVQVALSRIRRAILKETALWARRFFWVALAEAARLSSNSRTSTFKLHIRSTKDMEARIFDPIGVFKKAINRNLQNLKDHSKYLGEQKYLKRACYSKEVKLTLGDTREVRQSPLCDIVLTSPPYGDNDTTVPYGQHAFLPLHWIELNDIDPAVDPECLCSGHELDSRSLGGSMRIDKKNYEALADRSNKYKQCLEQLKDQPADRKNRITAFFRDFDACLDPILKGLRPGGLMVWTLGNRKVGGKRVPTDSILLELLASRRATFVCKLPRRIPSKRMAPKNSISETMSKETILVMRKAR